MPSLQRSSRTLFLSTPSARRATEPKKPPFGGLKISIHALREKGDHRAYTDRRSCTYFYPRPPREGRPITGRLALGTTYFYPRPPREGRRAVSWPASLMLVFLSTPSARRATTRGFFTPPNSQNFYPRPPRGGRPVPAAAAIENGKFLSTPSARRATRAPGAERRFYHISIHALREEGDYIFGDIARCADEFLSTPSARRATVCCSLRPKRAKRFLSTPSARRATGCSGKSALFRVHFYPRPPRGGRRGPSDTSPLDVKFLSTPSARRATQPSAGAR